MRPLALAICLVVLLAPACSDQARAPADNLLIVSFDTTRVDRLSAYGYAQPTTPELEGLAARGVRFDDAYTHVPSTLPSHCTMLTGLLPPSHGVRANGKFRLADARLTLGEILEEHGFDTGAVIGALPLDSRFGMDQGFAMYDGQFAVTPPDASSGSLEIERWFGHPYDRFERRADEVTDRAIGWLEERRERWFLLAHYFDPHTPYRPPAEWAERFPDPYDAEIAFADHQLGRLLRAVGRLPGRTLIVFTADHGEGLGDHGEPEHNRFLYDTTLRVPLVMALDDGLPGRRKVQGLVGLVDLLPTVLELLGIEAPTGLEGRSLVGAARATAPLEERPLYAETLVALYESGEKLVVRAMLDGSRKLIRTDTEQDGSPAFRTELYDRSRDPAELDDLASREPTAGHELDAELLSWSDALERAAPEPEAYELDQDMLDALRALGYLK